MERHVDALHDSARNPRFSPHRVPNCRPRRPTATHAGGDPRPPLSGLLFYITCCHRQLLWAVGSSGFGIRAAIMDVPCCFNTFAPAGISSHNHPMVFCPPPALPCSAPSSFFPLVAVSVGARKGGKNTTDGGALSTAQLMFRNMAALLYRSVPRKPKAEPAGSSSRFPPHDEEESGRGEAPEEEGRVPSEGTAEELECLEEEAIAGSRWGREPGDYDRRAHLFDESSRVFQALKEREEDQRRHQEGS